MIDLSPLLLWPEDVRQISEPIEAALHCMADRPQARRLQILIGEACAAGVGNRVLVAIKHDLTALLHARARATGGIDPSDIELLAKALELASDFIRDTESPRIRARAQAMVEWCGTRSGIDFDARPAAGAAFDLAARVAAAYDVPEDPIWAWSDAARILGQIAALTPDVELDKAMITCAEAVYARLVVDGGFRLGDRHEVEAEPTDEAADELPQLGAHTGLDVTPWLLWEDQIEAEDEFCSDEARRQVDSPRARRLIVLLAEASVAGVQPPLIAAVIREWAKLWCQLEVAPPEPVRLALALLDIAVTSGGVDGATNGLIREIEAKQHHIDTHPNDVAQAVKMAAEDVIEGCSRALSGFHGWLVTGRLLSAIVHAAATRGTAAEQVIEACAVHAYRELFCKVGALEPPRRVRRGRSAGASAGESKAARKGLAGGSAAA